MTEQVSEAVDRNAVSDQGKHGIAAGQSGDQQSVYIGREALDLLVKVARYVSAGRGFVDVEPYPDATARRALGALGDEGVL